MPIRIKQRDKPRDRVQPAKNKGLSALLATGPMAFMGTEIRNSTSYADQSNYCYAQNDE